MSPQMRDCSNHHGKESQVLLNQTDVGFINDGECTTNEDFDRVPLTSACDREVEISLRKESTDDHDGDGKCFRKQYSQVILSENTPLIGVIGNNLQLTLSSTSMDQEVAEVEGGKCDKEDIRTDRGPREKSDAATEDSEQHTPIDFYLQRLGDKQRLALEQVYKTAVEVPCQTLTTCEHAIEDFQCSFLKGKKRYDYDPCNRSLLGPRSCEYCKAETTLKCAWDCERPKLFSLKKRPPFESRDGWDPVTEYQIDAYYKDPLIDTNGICIETSTSKRREADGLSTFFQQTPNLICSFFQD